MNQIIGLQPKINLLILIEHHQQLTNYSDGIKASIIQELGIQLSDVKKDYMVWVLTNNQLTFQETKYSHEHTRKHVIH